MKTKNDQWKIQQRSTYRKGLLSPKRIALMEAIPGWKWEIYDFLSFKEAREFSRSLGLTSKVPWAEFCKTKNKPDNIPANPVLVYSEEWVGWSDWLGTEKEYLSFVEARSFAHTLGLKSAAAWREWHRNNRPPNIPAFPPNRYKKEWNGWSDWLGKIWMPFSDAKNFTRSLNLKTSEEWYDWWDKNCPPHIPKTPNSVYDEWKSMPDWLGTEYLSFSDAREFTHELNLKSNGEWIEYCESGKKPANIPKYPDAVYKESGWISYYDWLGLEWDGNHWSFQKVLKYVRPLKIGGIKEWGEYCQSGKKPLQIPSCPWQTYKKEWRGIRHFLFNSKPRVGGWQSYNDCKRFVKHLKLKTKTDWENYAKGNYPNLPQRPTDIPKHPDVVFKPTGEWESWGEWSGSMNTRGKDKTFLTFGKAKEILSPHKFTKDKYHVFRTQHPELALPSCPSRTYHNEWVSWPNYLGTNKGAWKQTRS